MKKSKENTGTLMIPEGIREEAIEMQAEEYAAKKLVEFAGETLKKSKIAHRKFWSKIYELYPETKQGTWSYNSVTFEITKIGD
ncbi:MAG: hypothetical protein WC374_06565 [Phycisphaerae bacterium]